MRFFSKNLKRGFVLYFLINNVIYAEIADPCAGNNALLSIVDRPTVGDSVCVVPYKKIVIEMGYSKLAEIHPGSQENFPQAELRIGLPKKTEFVALLPNYNNPPSGFGTTTLGIKHQLGYNSQWIVTIEGLVTPPSGTVTYGSKDWGGAFNGIVNYSFNDRLSLTGMLGVSSQSQSILDGGERFTSINPVVVLSYTKESLQWYLEVYGQSKVTRNMGAGFNVDTGFIYLIKQNITVDLVVGQRLTGTLGEFNRYVGAGFTLMLG